MEILRFDLIYGVYFFVLFLIVILLSKTINDFLTPYKIDSELTQKDNFALSLSIGGYFAAVTIIFIGSVTGPSQGIIKDLLCVGKYSLIGIILLNISRFVNDKLILYKFSNIKEIITDKNEGTGVVLFGSYVASGLIVAGAISGEGGGIVTAIVFFVLGQAGLIIFSWFYNFITPFDIHEEIENNNIAAGVAFGGTLIAVGIILMNGTCGNFISWKHNLNVFALNASAVIIFIPVIRFFFDKLIIPKSSLNHEIATDKNIGAGFLETVMVIGFAAIIFFII